MACQGTSPSIALTAIVNDVARAAEDTPATHWVLVVDDVHLISAPDVHEAMSFLLDHLPRRLHLLVATRPDPPLPLPLLRGRGELTEVRTADLRAAAPPSSTNWPGACVTWARRCSIDRIAMNDRPGPHTPAHYVLRAAGHLDEHWSTWFGALDITQEDDGTTTLRGKVADQAGLHGLLAKIRDLGATLISVTSDAAHDGTRQPSRSSRHCPSVSEGGD